jgi:hypothetical protein
MSYKTIFSTFLTGQLRSMGAEDRKAFMEKMTVIRAGTFSHHKVLQGNGPKLVMGKIGRKTDTLSLGSIEEVGCGLGGKWRVFFYRTGYVPKNTLEAERQRLGISKLNVPEGVLWCCLIGHLEGGDLELFVGSSNSEHPGAKTERKTIEERDAQNEKANEKIGKTIYKDEVAKLTEMTA